MNKLLSAFVLAAPLTLAACAAQVIGGGGTGGSGGSGGSGGFGSSGGPGGSIGTGAPALTAVALTRAQDDAGWDNYFATHGGGPGYPSGSGGPDPNDLFLHLSNLGVSCDLAVVDLTCGGHYDMTIMVPPAFQQVGTFTIEDPTVDQWSWMMNTGEGSGVPGDGCDSSGGSIVGGGTVEILSIDATAVHFRVDLEAKIWATDPSGEYTAARCP